MGTLLEDYNLQNNDEFQARVRMAALRACQAIIADTGRIDEHPFCLNALRHPMGLTWLMPIVMAVTTNPTVSEAGVNATDNDILYVVNSVMTDFTIPTA